jgi:hypothetical protein
MQRITREEAEAKILNAKGIQYASERERADLISINNTIFDYVDLLEENLIEAVKIKQKEDSREQIIKASESPKFNVTQDDRRFSFEISDETKKQLESLNKELFEDDFISEYFELEEEFYKISAKHGITDMRLADWLRDQ